MNTPLARVWLTAALVFTSVTAGASESVYDSTLKLCREHTEIGLTNLERVIYAVTYLYRREAGDPLWPEARVRISDPGIVLRNAKAVALDLNFGADQDLRTLVRSPEFYRALNECFPLSTYPNAAQLRGAFVIELLGLEGTGKALGIGATALTGEAVGVGLKTLRLFSVRAHAWALRAIIGTSIGMPALHLVAGEIERRRVEELLPRHRAARANHLTAAEQTSALGADLNDMAQTAGQALDLQTGDVDAVMDRLIEDLSGRLAKAQNEGERRDLEDKIKLLKDAR